MTQRIPQTDARDAGVALVEVLVALALTALIAGIMMTWLGQLGRLNGMERDLAREGEVKAAWDYVSELRARALPLPLLRDNPDRVRTIEITSRSVRFTAHVPAGLSGYGVREVTLACEADQDGLFELVQTARPRRFGEARDAAQRTVLAGSLEKCSLDETGAPL